LPSAARENAEKILRVQENPFGLEVDIFKKKCYNLL
jgi:hypothetical protein